MITYFGFKNFFSFREGADVSFILEKRLHESIPNKNGISYLMGIKGANGSGKTNIIRAIGFISSFIKESADYDVGKLIKIDSFFRNKEPSEFYVEFIINNKTYGYELSLDDKRVYFEKLTRKLKREVVVFERVEDKVTSCISSVSEFKKIKLKSNSSLISMSQKFSFESPMSDLSDVLKYFSNVFCNVGYSGLDDGFYSLNFSGVSRLYYENQQLRSFVVDFLKSMDDSLIDIRIIRHKPDDSDEYRYYPIFDHRYNDGEGSLLIHDESNGTKVLFKTISLYWVSMINGGFLALDEFDIHLHSMILPKILEMFENENINQANAQFLFTAHNTEIMDYLGKHRTILVDREGGESYCYRLDEMPSDILPNSIVRTDRKISGLYLKRKLGGVPRI